MGCEMTWRGRLSICLSIGRTLAAETGPAGDTDMRMHESIVHAQHHGNVADGPVVAVALRLLVVRRPRFCCARRHDDAGEHLAPLDYRVAVAIGFGRQEELSQRNGSLSAARTDQLDSGVVGDERGRRR